ncbi:hypothetical protein [Candidatus Berkiella aquae]|uniref:Uncharacterized protein n=1 Tax=Candidatus Berkiella aquae TaxID=295108 RepID=A0A0Q9YUE5_9GAMM|nr:hypothetical protein [Candidatus Berkiella aquae]MCS5710792.1 hypothetical protein [Candidatus Berkiella aquae]
MAIVRSWPMTAVILTGCFVTAPLSCFAKHQSLRERILDFKSMPFAHWHTSEAAKLSHPIFQYLYAEPFIEQPFKDPAILSLQAYKERLRGFVAYEFSQDFRVGLNSFKAGPLEQADWEVLSLQPELQPRSPDVAKSRGYGISFTVKLD